MIDLIIALTICGACVGIGLVIGASWGMQKARKKSDTLRDVWEAGVINTLDSLLADGCISDDQHTAYMGRFIVKFGRDK